jgi:hypothetical protein
MNQKPEDGLEDLLRSAAEELPASPGFQGRVWVRIGARQGGGVGNAKSSRLAFVALLAGGLFTGAGLAHAIQERKIAENRVAEMERCSGCSNPIVRSYVFELWDVD